MRKKIEINNDGFQEVTDKSEAAPPEQETIPEPKQGSAPVSVPEDTAAYITALQAELEEARQIAEDAEKRVLYVQAEFQNFRRRKEDEFKDLQKYTNGELIKSLLPILDNFERALSAAEQTRNMDALLAGISGTLKQMQSFLQKAGVTAIDAVGKEFDPKFHEAIGHTESEAFPANTVAEEVQRGYLIHDRVLRPSLVKVVQG